MKRVCFVTSTRADWGLLKPLATMVRDCGEVELQIIATNMHLLKDFGYTLDEISRDGFNVDVQVPMDVDGDSEYSRAKSMARCADGMADAFERLKPDLMVLLGDRYEMLSVASIAAVMLIPIVHIAGGEISEGAVDDSFRHAITKLSTLHLTATEPYRQRVIQMGENPRRVINTGAIGAWNARNVEAIPREELEQFLNIRLDGKVAVVTYHPATLDHRPVADLTRQFLDALAQHPDLTYIITYPNNDAHGAEIIPLLKDFAQKHPANVRVVSSLGMKRYQNLLRYACTAIGNSSSGIVEVPSWGIPTVDVGVRQRGRLAADSVIHCGTSTAEISEAIALAIKIPHTKGDSNPYYKPDTPVIMFDALMDFVHSLPVAPKTFHDIIGNHSASPEEQFNWK